MAFFLCVEAIFFLYSSILSSMLVVRSSLRIDLRSNEEYFWLSRGMMGRCMQHS